MATRRTLLTRIVRDLSTELAALARPLVFGVATDGEILVAGRLQEGNLSDERAAVTFPKPILGEAHDWLVIRAQATGPVRRLLVRAERSHFSHVQPLADGVLLVAARCHWRPEGAEQNAVVVDADGVPVRRFTLGDGIEDVRTTPSGDIWASYFDEGVFGNCGWGGPGPEPIGAAGLIEFDQDGHQKRAFDASAARTDAICDAYSLNVDASGTVHVYFYSEFPIVRIRDGAYARWACGVSGAHVLAVRSDRALLAGRYADPAVAYLLDLRGDGEAVSVEEATVETPEGAPVATMQSACVGADVFFLDGSRVLQLRDW